MPQTKSKRYAGVIVKVGREVLLCKRNNDGELPGEWSIPAGKLNNSETPKVAAKREFFEETNINIDGSISLCGFVPRKNRSGNKIRGLMYVFLWENDKKIYPDLFNAKDGEEHTECGFFGLNDLPLDKDDYLYKLINLILS